MITSNFNNVLLLCNGIVVIKGDRGEIYKMRLPTLQDSLENPDFPVLLGFCGSSLDSINSKLNTHFKDRYEMYKYYKKNNIKDMLKILKQGFEKYMIDFELVDDCLKWNKRIIPKQIFNFFCDYFAIACGVKNIKDLELVIQDDMDEFTKKQIMMELRVQKTKQNGESDGPKTDMGLILAAVNYEFGYKMSELYNMTLYGIYFLYSQVSSIMSYQIGNIAAGNGLMKKTTKHSYWTNNKK